MAVCAYSAKVAMTQDEIIEIASQVYGECVWHESALLRLEAFVKLVAAREREACAKVCDELPAPDQYSNTDKSMWEVTCIDCADAIRARGDKAWK